MKRNRDDVDHVYLLLAHLLTIQILVLINSLSVVSFCGSTRDYITGRYKAVYSGLMSQSILQFLQTDSGSIPAL